MCKFSKCEIAWGFKPTHFHEVQYHTILKAYRYTSTISNRNIHMFCVVIKNESF